eukprot:gene10025-12286_t
MTMIVRNLQQVRDRITTACMAAGRRPDSVRLLAVSKTFAADAVIDAIEDGQCAFGENYIAEGVEKILALRAFQAEPHNANAWTNSSPFLVCRLSRITRLGEDLNGT